MIRRKDIKGKMVSCYYEDGVLRQGLTGGNMFILLFLFPLVWMGIVFYAIESLIFRSEFYLTEKEYYEWKLKEVIRK